MMEKKQQDFGKEEGKKKGYRIDSPKITKVKASESVVGGGCNNFEKLFEMEQDKNRILLFEKQLWTMKEDYLNKMLFDCNVSATANSSQNSNPSIVRVGYPTCGQQSNHGYFSKSDSNLLSKKSSSFSINNEELFNPSHHKLSSSLPTTITTHLLSSASSINNFQNSNISTTTATNTAITAADEVPGQDLGELTVLSINHHPTAPSLPSPEVVVVGVETTTNNSITPIPPPKPIDLVLRKSSKDALVLLDQRQFLFKQFLSSLKEYQQLIEIFNKSFIKAIVEESNTAELKRHVIFDHLTNISEENVKCLDGISKLLSRNGIILVGEEQTFIVLAHQLFETVQLNYFSFFDQYFAVIQLFKSEKSKCAEFKQAMRKVEQELVERRIPFWKFETFLTIPSQFVQKMSNICEKILKSSDKFYIGLEHYAKLDQLVLILQEIVRYSKSKLEGSNDLSQLLDISKQLSIEGLATHKRKVLHSYFMAERVRNCGNVTPCQLFLFNDLFLIKYPRKYRWFKMKLLTFHLDEINRHGLPIHAVQCKDSEVILIRGDFECKQLKICIRFKNEEEATRWKDEILNCIERECLDSSSSSSELFLK